MSTPRLNHQLSNIITENFNNDQEIVEVNDRLTNISRDDSLFGNNGVDGGSNKRMRIASNLGRESRAGSLATLSQINEDPTKFLKMNNLNGSQMQTNGHIGQQQNTNNNMSRQNLNQYVSNNDPSVMSEDSDAQRKRMRAILERDFQRYDLNN